MATHCYTRAVLLLLAVGLLWGCQPLPDQHVEPASAIRLNQVGFLPEGPKVAVIAAPTAYDSFAVQSATGAVVWEGALSEQVSSVSTGEQVQVADFSDLATPGTYHLDVAGLGASHPFEIREDIYLDVARTTAKALYFNRSSTALSETYAGAWARAAGHPDTSVIVHPSAASEERPPGTRIASPGGWYDAGDYNKYIVPAAYTSYFLLAAYEDAPDLVATLDLNLPESGNAVPDLLDEALWNLRWMRTMQDADGGLYHKLTHAAFSGMVMPEAATEPRYVVQKTTAAALTFSAAMAQAARVFADFEATLPGLADSCRTAALRAWAWAEANPDVLYRQNELNEQYDPDLSTGAYADEVLDDEWYWARLELFLMTGDPAYYPETRPEAAITPYWEKSVALLGDWSMARHTEAGSTALPHHQILQQVADDELVVQASSAYRMAMERDEDFYWGATGTTAAKAGVFLQAYRQTGEDRYRAAAIHVLDYLLGRNGTTYSFVTGMGAHSPLYPHHRPSEADGVAAPVPGWLVGGPGNLTIEDCENYPSARPALHYVDETCSYSTNEITTYWNTPLTHAALLLQAGG